MFSFRHSGVAAILILTALGAGGCATHQNAVDATSHLATEKIAALPGSKGQVRTSLSCEPVNVATVAVVRSDVGVPALSGLIPRPLAVVRDHGTGQMAFFHSDARPAKSDAAMFATSPRIVRDDPSLQSCNMLLADRPAAQPFIRVAIAAAVARGMANSASSLRTRLSGVEIGDNPVVSGSLIVVLVVAGPAQRSIAGHKVYGPNSSIFVILNRASMAVTGISHGGW